MNDAKYIGLDVHQATISATVLDSTGKIVMEAILETKAETILQFIHGLRGSLHVTFEECTCEPLARAHPDTTPVPQQATTMELQRSGIGDTQQRGILHGAWPAQALRESHSHPRAQQES